MAILPHIMPSYGEATALSGMLALISVVVTAIRKYRFLKWKKFIFILATFLIVSFFSVKAIAGMDEKRLKHILGAILIIVSIYFFISGGRIKVKPSRGIQVGMGTLSGLMGGFFAMQGPPAVIYFISCTDSKDEYIAMASSYFVIGNCMMTLFRASEGFVTAHVLKCFLLGLPAVLLGYLVGRAVFEKMPVQTMRKVVYSFMAASGILALFA